MLIQQASFDQDSFIVGKNKSGCRFAAVILASLKNSYLL